MAILVRVGRVGAAREELGETLPRLPVAMRTINGLRKSYFDFGPSAWHDMVEALTTAGMT